MKDLPVGYSIVEVMIVLGISGIIFVSGWALFAGQSAETGFNQAVQDLASEISFRTKEVSASTLFNAQGYSCNVNGNPPRATLSAGSGSQTGNQDCLVLGKAFEVLSGSSDIYIHTVLGNRLNYVSGVSVGPSGSLGEANPTTATVADGDLTYGYKLSSSTKILSSKTTIGSGETASSLVGYYIDFNGESGNNQNGSQSFSPWSYNYQAAAHDPNAVKACIEGSGCTAPSSLSLWRLCVASPEGSRTAELNVSNSSAGVTTAIKFASCS